MPSYYDFYAVVESAIDSDQVQASYKILNQGHGIDNSLNFLRYQACLMTVGTRNRNRRLWTKPIMDVMMNAPHIVEMFRRAGGLPGESGHPIPPTGQVSMERLVTIDPENLAILIKEWWWDGEAMMGIVETLDQGEGTPGNKLMKRMLQGMVPAHSIRSLVPQRRNADGSIDVTGPGRFVTTDSVIGPSCENAYLDISIPVKNIIKKAEFDTVMESYTNYALERSEAVKRVIDDMRPAMESAAIDANTGFMGITTETDGRVFIPMEKKFRKDISAFMRKGF